MLCQLSYTRPHWTTNAEIRSPGLLLPRFFVNRMPTQFRAVLLELQPLRAPSLFNDPVVPQPGLRTFQPDVFSHRNTSAGQTAPNLIGNKTKLAHPENPERASLESHPPHDRGAIQQSWSQHPSQPYAHLHEWRNGCLHPWQSAYRARLPWPHYHQACTSLHRQAMSQLRSRP